MAGAIDLDNCPTRSSNGGCYCGRCVVCGNTKHSGIHGPECGKAAGSKPWGHEFKAKAANAK